MVQKLYKSLQKTDSLLEALAFQHCVKNKAIKYTKPFLYFKTAQINSYLDFKNYKKYQ